VMELLQNREAFVQCLELRDSIQSVVGASHMLSEMGERISELDLSLAGVSDSTARHGKAVSTLADQQKTTSSTLGAVVRAVKRLAQSRSKAWSPGRVSDNSSLNSRDMPNGKTAVDEWEGAKDVQDAHDMHDVVTTHSGQSQSVYSEDCLEEAGGWGDGVEGALPSPRSCGVNQSCVAAANCDLRWDVIDGYQGTWSSLWGERASNVPWSCGRPRRNPVPAGTARRHCSGPPGSRPNSWGSGRVLGGPRRRLHARTYDCATIYPDEFRDSPRVYQESPRLYQESPRVEAALGGKQEEMGTCVQGVLARIEEALNKLDGPEVAPSASTRISDTCSARGGTPAQPTPRGGNSYTWTPGTSGVGSSGPNRQASSGSSRSGVGRRRVGA
jgi:hypothetical protein